MALSSGHRIAVAGAHDPLCRRVAELLLRRDEVHVSASCRRPTELMELAAPGARIFAAGPDNSGSLEAAFAEATGLLLQSTAADGVWARRRQLEAALTAAVNAGVGNVVFAAVADAFNTFPITVARDCTVVAQVCEVARLALTVLRVGWPVESLFPRIALALQCGEWLTSAPDSRLSLVAREDVARTATSALVANTVTEGNLESQPVSAHTSGHCQHRQLGLWRQHRGLRGQRGRPCRPFGSVLSGTSAGPSSEGNGRGMQIRIGK